MDGMGFQSPIMSTGSNNYTKGVEKCMSKTKLIDIQIQIQ